MAQSTTIKLGTKTYKLKFGYGVNRRLADVYSIPSYSGLGDFIASLNFSDQATDLTFDQLNFLGNLVHAAIAYQEGETPELTVDEIVDAVLQQPDKLTNVMLAFADSFPKETSEGKQKPGQKKRK